MFKRKLLALDFPDPDTFDLNDESKFHSILLWLEDQKIRHLKIEDRAPLRGQGEEWNKAFEAYLKSLNCPYDLTNKPVLLDWLLGYAARLEYGDGLEKYKNVTPEKYQQRKNQLQGESSNPLDSLDFDSAEFKAGVTSLAMLLQVPPHQDHLEQLKAICLIIEEKFSTEAIEASKKVNKEKDEHIPLEKTELGFEAGDYIINDAAKILRLLHLRDLRDLQTKINSAIVAVQGITANPKTDTKLGKVGR
ncbi:RNA transcription, translation and transport factor protein-like [Physella acuta]|uniref:RNA transcription, translation and transport factor protein-like n=1 Tax=Physella acuta TaxID=109671 RepID=UPI0027DB1101|nr:RNA transcription, translation and transport factor protein-like [Physella acuta]